MTNSTFRSALTGVATASFLLASAGVHAQSAINQTHALDPEGRVEIDNVKGRIQVEAWDRPEVRITGTLGKGVEKLEVEGDRGHLSIEVKYPNRGGFGLFSSDNTGPTDLQVMVPIRAELEIDSVAANVDVKGVAPREVSIDSVSGDVVLVGAPAELSIDSVSGDVRATTNSRSVDVASVSGDIHLSGRLEGEVGVETVSGNADVGVHESSVRSLSGSSVSGDLRIRTALVSGGDISLETVSGDVDLRLPANLSAEVRGESFSGDLEAPGARIERPEHGPGSSFQHRYGNGDGDISIETFSGDARLQLD